MKNPKFQVGDILVRKDNPLMCEVIMLTSNLFEDNRPFSKQLWYNAKFLFSSNERECSGLQSVIEDCYVKACNISEGNTAEIMHAKIKKIIAILRVAEKAKSSI